MAALLKDRLKEKIDHANISMAELERKASLPQGSVRKIVAGITKNPSIDTMISIAEALQCRVESFLDSQFSKKKSMSIEKKDIFDPVLFEECVKYVAQYFFHNNIQKTFDDSLSIIKEIYVYSLTEGKLETRFASWILSKKD